MSTNRISVVLTTYRRAEGLRQSLESLHAQSRPPEEVIVCDDCSPDHTPQVVEQWRSRFASFRYFRHERNRGMPGNLNYGMERATGDFIANLHDGDLFDPRMLELWARQLERHPTAGFVFSGIGNFNNQSQPILHEVAEFTPGREFYERHYLHQWASLVWGTVMGRKSAYDRLLPFREAYGFISDVDMWIRMCQHFDVAYVRQPLILLDNSPSEERGWVWKNHDAMRRLQHDNLAAFYADDPARLRAELRRHARRFRHHFLRGLLGACKRGLRRRDFRELPVAWSYCRKIGLPLSLIFGGTAS